MQNLQWINSVGLPNTTENVKDNLLKNTMNEMMNNLQLVKLTGMTDVDYVLLMIPHHQYAIQMAQFEMRYGKHKDLIAMANVMINEQNKEINQFHNWLKWNNKMVL